MAGAAYPPIEAHGLIGDQRTAALVAADGSIDWCCLPCFDGDIVFGALLDQGRGGRWRLGPREDGDGTGEYLGETALWRTRWVRNEGNLELELVDAMVVPSAGSAGEAPTLLRRLQALHGRCECRMELDARLNFAGSAPVLAGGVATPPGSPGQLALWTSDAQVGRTVAAGTGCTFVLDAGQEFWAALGWTASGLRGWSVARAHTALARTAAFWRRWARRHPWLGPRRNEVEASLRAIRLLAHAQHGSQVAAPTTSLPERIGGDRNHDYRFAWVRDSSLALAILAVFGDLRSAERYMDWLAAREAGDQLPLQVLYRVDGQKDGEERQLADVDGYCGSRPVRVGNRAAGQFQLDSLGYLADCALIYLQHGGRWKAAYSHMLERMANFTAAHWQRPDHGIWELDEQRQYVSSKAMAWVVFERTCRVWRRLGVPVPEHWEQAREAIHAQVMERGWCEALQAFRQHYESEEPDASTLLLSLMDFLPADHPRMIANVAAIQRHLQQDGFVWRFHPRSCGCGDLPLDGLQASFLPCTFWLASALARMGRTQEAGALLDRVHRLCGARHLLPEEFDPVQQRALGNYPLLFSHAEHLRAVMDLAKAGPLGLAGMLASKAAGAVARASGAAETHLGRIKMPRTAGARAREPVRRCPAQTATHRKESP